ncbi:MAG: hypothetical protein IJ761_03075 [Bacteroidales bacterium]|nr:hypothetical protein [Bacteroidales bacterium]
MSNCAAAHVAYILSAEPTAYHSDVADTYPIALLHPRAKYVDECSFALIITENV